MFSQKQNQSWAETIEALAMFDQWTSVHYADVTQGWQLLRNYCPDLDKKKLLPPNHTINDVIQRPPGQVENMPIQDLTAPVVVTFNWSAEAGAERSPSNFQHGRGLRHPLQDLSKVFVVFTINWQVSPALINDFWSVRTGPGNSRLTKKVWPWWMILRDLLFLVRRFISLHHHHQNSTKASD